MAIKKLVVRMAKVTKTHQAEFEEGYTWPCFVDPETGKSYDPKNGFEVTGENLEDLFEESPTDSESVMEWTDSEE